MPHPRLRPFVLPWTRRELPGSHRLFRFVAGRGAEGDTLWAGTGRRVVRGRNHGYRVELDLANWADRFTYFMGRYYEAGVELTLRRLVRPGDRVADVGANHGMITLLLARLVGPAGQVEAFEPNPRCLDVLARQVALNTLRHVKVHPVALSDANGAGELRSIAAHDGYGTLAPMQDGAADVFPVVTRRGDELLQVGRSLSLVKIDVEGYESHVLRGLAKTLDRHLPAVVTEVNPHCLERAGSSVAQLRTLLVGRGYRGYVIGCDESRWGRKLRLTPSRGPEDLTGNDAVWLHASDARLRRLPITESPTETTVTRAA